MCNDVLSQVLIVVIPAPTGIHANARMLLVMRRISLLMCVHPSADSRRRGKDGVRCETHQKHFTF